MESDDHQELVKTEIASSFTAPLLRRLSVSESAEIMPLTHSRITANISLVNYFLSCEANGYALLPFSEKNSITIGGVYSKTPNSSDIEQPAIFIGLNRQVSHVE